MGPREMLKEQFLQMVDQQLEKNDPAPTRLTYNRLQSEGYSQETARLMIAQCVAAEIRETLAVGEPFNKTRYVESLDRLPQPPELQR